MLDRPSQLVVRIGTKASNGFWAPTIRHHNGLCYMIITAQDSGGNIYFTAKDLAGSWSDPGWLRTAPGIDPSPFWRDDCTCWYTGAGWIEGGKRRPGENRIYLQQLDPERDGSSTRAAI